MGLCGDLKFGRTVHSLIRAMMRYENIKFVLVSPKELQVPDYIRDDRAAATSSKRWSAWRTPSARWTSST